MNSQQRPHPFKRVLLLLLLGVFSTAVAKAAPETVPVSGDLADPLAAANGGATRYHVLVKMDTHSQTLGPFAQREAAERALDKAFTEHRVSYAQIAAETRTATGEIDYRILRVFHAGGEESAGSLVELMPPNATTLPAATPDEVGPARARSTGVSAPIEVLSHPIVAYEPGKFSAWPANNGAQTWQWGMEILVGYFDAVYEEKEGHNWAPPTQLLFARSTDGGATWTPTEFNVIGPGPAPGSIDFAHPDFALRIFDEEENFYISYDRGQTWNGPAGFGDLLDDSPVAGDEFSARTDYIVNSPSQAFFFLSSRREFVFTEDYVYMAKTDDGGASFDFVSFLDPYDVDRSVMPSTVRVDATTLVSCTRRKNREDRYWIECYRSTDNGQNWSSLGEVDNTGEQNGNPAALVRLASGELVCIYGVREPRGTSRMSAKVSADNGSTWSLEYRLREDYGQPDAFGEVELGYPRAFVRPDGKVVAVYYWVTAERPEPHLAATIFQVGDSPDPATDSDDDGIPDRVEADLGTDPWVKDNDIFNDAQLFAMQQYRDFLSREGDVAGIEYWEGLIDSGTVTRSDLIAAMLNTAEFSAHTAPIAQLYFAYFLRVPDYAGFAYWVQAHHAGISLPAIAQAFAQSAEFRALYGENLSNTEYVVLLYQNIVRRPPDSGGLAYWTNQLDSGALDRGEVALAFAESTEFQGRIANAVSVSLSYLGMLRRSPDPSEFDFWLLQLDGGIAVQVLIDELMAASAYHERFLPAVTLVE